MRQDITAVKPLDDYRLWLRFEDGVEGVVDIAAQIPFRGVFAPLQDKTIFDQVRVNPETGTICWSEDVDLDPDVLYAVVTGISIPTFVEEIALA